MTNTDGKTCHEAKVIEVRLECPLVSELNMREHWTRRKKRKDIQQLETRIRLNAQSGRITDDKAKLRVTITRVGRRLLDPTDNRPSSAKHVIDAVAKWLGRDDREGSGVEFCVEQRKCAKGEQPHAVILIEEVGNVEGVKQEASK